MFQQEYAAVSEQASSTLRYPFPYILGSWCMIQIMDVVDPATDGSAPNASQIGSLVTFISIIVVFLLNHFYGLLLIGLETQELGFESRRILSVISNSVGHTSDQ